MKYRSLCIMVVIGLAAGLPSRQARAFGARPAEECPELASWLQARHNLPSDGSDAQAWSEYQERDWNELQSGLQQVFQHYIAGALNIPGLAKCLSDPDDQKEFATAMPDVFLDGSLALLQKSPDPMMQLLVERAREREAQGQGILFQVAGAFIPPPAGAPNLGGFHRGSGTVFMDFTETPPREWLLVFTHEMIHGLDDRLMQAALQYSDANTAGWETAGPADAQKFQSVDSWLLAGLDRGYLAEARAWAVTASLYTSAIATGFLPRVDWMDEVVQARPSGQAWFPFCLRYLDPSFPDPQPQEGPLSIPFVQQQLSEIRAGIRDGAQVPVMTPSLQDLLPKS